MATNKLHHDEVAVNVQIVQQLLAEQFPQWANLHLKVMEHQGTDNVMYQLGDDKVLRLPRMERSAANIQKERQWLPTLEPHLPIAIPHVIAEGHPDERYPFPWLVCGLLQGKQPDESNPFDVEQAAKDLGHFVVSMQKINSSGAPRCQRGLPLQSRDEEMRAAIPLCSDVFDTKRVQEIWEAALALPEWSDTPVWIHGDLHAGNLLVKDGKVTAVVDFGSSGSGDPASDLMVAWTLLTKETREIFRSIVQPDEATWERGRAWALTMGVVAYPYYRDTNPAFACIAKRATDAALLG